MIADFNARFDSYYSAYSDLRLYHECKSYRYEGSSMYWEPLYEVDVEPEPPIDLGDYECYDADTEF